ncbi:MAG: glycosyltransferase [bacterium]|nr:glycosyltransferase [bacterium]
MHYICVPAYNERAAIGRVLDRTRAAMERRGYPYRVLVYDDGSTDGTADIAEGYAASMPVTVIRGGVNRGLRAGMEALLRKAVELSAGGDDVAVMLEGDDTQNPEQIFRMADRITEGFDVVVASRFRRGARVVGLPAARRALSLGGALVMKLLFPNKGVSDYTSGFRAYRTAILAAAFDRYGGRLIEGREFSCASELILRLGGMGAIVAEIPIVLRYDRKGGVSKMRVARNIFSTLAMLVRLRVALWTERPPHRR